MMKKEEEEAQLNWTVECDDRTELWRAEEPRAGVVWKKLDRVAI